jgi:uncharacterized protein (TIGR02118 family)
MIKAIFLIKKKPDMTYEQFNKRWLEGHAPINLQHKNLVKYVINTVIEEYNDKTPEYDGIAEMYWESFELMQEDFNSEVAKKAFPDGGEFIQEIIILNMKENMIKNPD